MSKEGILRQLKEIGPRLDRQYGVSLIILFGSVASGYSHTGSDLSSDVDVAVYLSAANMERKKQRRQGPSLSEYLFNNKLMLVGEFTDLLRTDSVDITLINECPPALKYEIFAKGILAYCRDEIELEELYLAAMRDYFDIQPMLERQFCEAQEYLSS